MWQSRLFPASIVYDLAVRPIQCRSQQGQRDTGISSRGPTFHYCVWQLFQNLSAIFRVMEEYQVAPQSWGKMDTFDPIWRFLEGNRHNTSDLPCSHAGQVEGSRLCKRGVTELNGGKARPCTNSLYVKYITFPFLNGCLTDWTDFLKGKLILWAVASCENPSNEK